MVEIAAFLVIPHGMNLALYRGRAYVDTRSTPNQQIIDLFRLAG